MRKITLAFAFLTGLAGFAQTQINLPINWDGGSAVNYTVTDFGGNASSVVVDPTNAGNMVLKSDKTVSAQTWAGTTLSTPSGLASAIPFSAGNTIISVAVWSPDAGIQVRLKAEDHNNNTISVETEATTVVANAWDTLTFNFANQASGTAAINFASTYDMLSIFYNFGVDGATAGAKTYYCDDVFFGGGAPSLAQVDLPITFDNAGVNYNTVSFGSAIDSIVEDPTDPTNMVLRQDKPAGAQTWAGTVCGDAGLANPIPFVAGSTIMSVSVWAANSGTVIRMKVEDSSNGAISVETEATTTMAGAWETLVFDFANNASGTASINFSNTYNKVVLFGDFNAAGSGKTFYFDNILFGMPTTQIDLPITFDDAMVNYDLVSFGDATDTIVVDPTDPNNMVLKQDKPAGAQTWAGTVVGDGGLANAIPFTATHHFMTARVWSADAGTPILMKVEDPANGATSVETFATTTVAGAWETLTFDFTNNAPGTPAIDYNNSYGKVVIFGDFGNPASGKTFYFDDIEFSASGIGMDESLSINDFVVRPNPSTGNFIITGTLNGLNDIEITVTDLQGRVIYSSKERAELLNKVLNLEGTENGMYILRISSSNGSITEKLMIAN